MTALILWALLTAVLTVPIVYLLLSAKMWRGDRS